MKEGNILLFIISVLVAGLSSCVKQTAIEEDNTMVRFGAELAQTTRVQNDQWQTGDQIGVFMIAGGGMIAADIKEGAYNRRYVYDDGFTAGDADIFYPLDGTSELDFVGIYPWREDISGDQYPVSVAVQGDPAALDILYARTEGIENKNGGAPVMLTFHHKLSILSIKVIRGEGMDNANFSNMTATIGGMPTAGTLNLNSGEVIPAGDAGNIEMLKGSHIGTDYVGVFDAIVLPSDDATGRSVVFTVEGIDYTWAIPEDVVLTEGLRQTYEITVKRAGVDLITATITPWNEEVTSSIADMTNIYLSGSGLEADLQTISDYTINTKRLRILGGELTANDFAFIRNNMFNLTELDMKNATVEDDLIPNNAFENVSALRKIILPDGITEIGDLAFSRSGLTSVVIPENVTAIGEQSFYDCASLVSVAIPGSLETFGNSAFHSCRALTSVTIAEGVTQIGHQGFYGCTSLTSIIFPNSLIFLRTGAFDNTGLISVIIPGNVILIDYRAFCNCPNLVSVTCLPIVPPTIGEDIFLSTSDNLVILVPAASVNAYISAYNWSVYASRIQAIPQP